MFGDATYDHPAHTVLMAVSISILLIDEVARAGGLKGVSQNDYYDSVRHNGTVKVVIHQKGRIRGRRDDVLTMSKNAARRGSEVIER